MKREFYRDDDGHPCWRDVLPAKAADQKTVAERKWREGLKPAKAQQPCDHGLFSDEADQLDLMGMFQQPVED